MSNNGPHHKCKTWTDRSGIEHLNFDFAQKKARKMTAAELEYARDDALQAVKTNPTCSAAGRWADEASVYGAELKRRSH